MRNRIFTLILLFSAVLLSACNGAAPISPGVDECTVSTQSTDCIDPTKPVCKDDGSGKMTCQAECTVATQSTDCPAAKPVCKDDGSGKMTCQAKPSSGDECTDNSGCTSVPGKPICDTSVSPKVCRAANSVDECKTLNPNPGTCQQVTYDATNGCGTETITTAQNGDGCCPSGATHATDTDCPATDECTDNNGCTSVSGKPICDTSVSPKVCRAAKDLSECKALKPSPGVCEKVTYDATSGCGTETITTTQDGDGCCPSGATHATDTDCPATDECTDNNGCSGTTPICDTSATPKVCRAATDLSECKALNPSPGVCKKVTYDATNGCGVAEKAASGKTTDGCCPAGANHANDADCPATDECTDNNGCKSVSGKPICDTTATPKVCRAANDQADCDALPTDKDTCEKYTYDSSKHVCNLESGNRAGDSCCPKGSKHTDDADCDECTDNNGCSGATPICDTGVSPKLCRAAKDVDECKALNPNPGVCKKVTYDATSGCGMESITTDKNSDGCCLPGHYSDVDNDCPVKCSAHSDCKDPAKPICLEDANHTKVCQAPLTAKVGGACLQDDECGVGGFCVTEKMGYPGGYCVIALPGCSTDSKICSTNIGVSGKTSECVTVHTLTSSLDMCFQGCSSDKDCRSGYACDSTGDHSCWPNVISFATDKKGQGCNTADDCQEDLSYPDDRIECKKAPAGDGDTWRNGYCTADCSADPGVCPTGMTCADVDGQKRCF